jgi:hypothetical protein
MGSTGRNRLLRQLLAGVAALALVASITYILGRALMPHFASTIADITATITTTSPSFDPQQVIDDLPYPAAAVAITGAVEDQLVLGQPVGTSGLDVVDPSSNDIDIRYQGEQGSSLRILARGVAVGEPRSTALTVIIAKAGLTFSAQAGDCTLLVHRFEYTTVTRPAGNPTYVPFFAGQLDCTIAELRSGELATFRIAFDF